MLVKEIKHEQHDGIYFEAVFDSSNILQTTYFPHANLLYVSFKRGGVYSYANINKEMYEEFKAAESQGKFFIEKIKKHPQKHPYRKEFNLFPSEIDKLNEEVEKNKGNQEEDES